MPLLAGVGTPDQCQSMSSAPLTLGMDSVILPSSAAESDDDRQVQKAFERSTIGHSPETRGLGGREQRLEFKFHRPTLLKGPRLPLKEDSVYTQPSDDSFGLSRAGRHHTGFSNLQQWRHD